MLIFEDFLPLKRQLVTALSETRALISRKYEPEDTKQSKKIQTLQIILSAFLRFCFKILASEMLILPIFLTAK